YGQRGRPDYELALLIEYPGVADNHSWQSTQRCTTGNWIGEIRKGQLGFMMDCIAIGAVAVFSSDHKLDGRPCHGFATDRIDSRCVRNRDFVASCSVEDCGVGKLSFFLSCKAVGSLKPVAGAEGCIKHSMHLGGDLRCFGRDNMAIICRRVDH